MQINLLFSISEETLGSAQAQTGKKPPAMPGAKPWNPLQSFDLSQDRCREIRKETTLRNPLQCRDSIIKNKTRNPLQCRNSIIKNKTRNPLQCRGLI